MVRAGTVLAGRYRLEQRIGSGGMGEVWRAFDGVLGRTVAVKCLLSAPADEPEFVDRFRAEARTMATISHPAVVEVYDFGDDPAAGMYLVMKYIEGESLAQALARSGRLTVEATMRLVADAAEALHAAHEKGVTHRDVKPGNLLLRTDGSTVLTDFGIARSAGSTGHTTTGSLVGTAEYFAPERAHGNPATARSDIYSLGVVAYRCLAGRLPFTGDSLLELALRHVNDDPAPLPPEVPAGVRAVVERAMAKDPAARWPSAAVFAHEARRALGSEPATVRTTAVPARRSGRRVLVAVAAVALVAIIGSASVLLNRDDPSRQSLVDNPGTGAVVPHGGGPSTSPSPQPSAVAPTPTARPTTSPRAATAGTPKAKRPPAAPRNLTATPIDAGTIRLRWSDSSADETGFTIINGATSRNVGANKTSFDWTGLSPSSYSCFKVRAFNSSGVSAYEPTAEGTWACATSLSGTGPAAPTSLTATAVSPAIIRLQWTDASADEDGFTVINGIASRNVGADTTAYEWTGLSPGTYMCFKVRSYKSSGVSAYYPAAEGDWVCLTTPTS